MHEINHRSPETMTPDQRRAEIASYLAKGIARLRMAPVGSSANSGGESKVLLGFSGDQSVHVNPSNGT